MKYRTSFTEGKKNQQPPKTVFSEGKKKNPDNPPATLFYKTALPTENQLSRYCKNKCAFYPVLLQSDSTFSLLLLGVPGGKEIFAKSPAAIFYPDCWLSSLQNGSSATDFKDFTIILYINVHVFNLIALFKDKRKSGFQISQLISLHMFIVLQSKTYAAFSSPLRGNSTVRTTPICIIKVATKYLHFIHCNGNFTLFQCKTDFSGPYNLMF